MNILKSLKVEKQYPTAELAIEARWLPGSVFSGRGTSGDRERSGQPVCVNLTMVGVDDEARRHLGGVVAVQYLAASDGGQAGLVVAAHRQDLAGTAVQTAPVRCCELRLDTTGESTPREGKLSLQAFHATSVRVWYQS